jgi:hypothetical protein
MRMVNQRDCAGAKLAAAFREFDALWEKPNSPERNARMEAILCQMGDTVFLDEAADRALHADGKAHQ